MIFRANSLHSVAGATGVVSCVQLPKAGRVAAYLFDTNTCRTLPAATDATLRTQQQRAHLARQQARHRAQCRANCMSKANF